MAKRKTQVHTCMCSHDLRLELVRLLKSSSRKPWLEVQGAIHCEWNTTSSRAKPRKDSKNCYYRYTFRWDIAWRKGNSGTKVERPWQQGYLLYHRRHRRNQIFRATSGEVPIRQHYGTLQRRGRPIQETENKGISRKWLAGGVDPLQLQTRLPIWTSTG